MLSIHPLVAGDLGFKPRSVCLWDLWEQLLVDDPISTFPSILPGTLSWDFILGNYVQR